MRRPRGVSLQTGEVSFVAMEQPRHDLRADPSSRAELNSGDSFSLLGGSRLLARSCGAADSLISLGRS